MEFLKSFDFIIFWMVFMHVIADYNLQGWLASAKQKSYWKENYPDKEMYNNDWIMALMMHSFTWSFMILIPLIYYKYDAESYLIALVVNTVIHFFVDDLKCNRFKISLYTDQTAHLLQIVFTWILWGVFV